MIDDPPKSNGQWLHLNWHCRSNKPVAHLISITWPSIETFRSRKIEAYQRHRNKKWKRQQ